MAEMTRRERVYAAANHKETDRVPICFAGATATYVLECPPDGRNASRLQGYLGLKDSEPIQISDIFNQPTNIDNRLIERLHSDMRTVVCNPPGAIEQADGSKTWPWFFGMRIKRTGLYDDAFDFPMRHMHTKEDIDAYPWPDPSADIMDGVCCQSAKWDTF